MYTNFDQHKVNLKTEETARIDDITKATNRKDDIQKQIEVINVYNKYIVETQVKKGQEDMISEQFLNLEKNFD